MSCRENVRSRSSGFPFGPQRLAELRKKLPTISEQVLADQLRQLDGDGVLTRKVTVTNPPQVAYSLNAEDKKLVPLNGNSL